MYFSRLNQLQCTYSILLRLYKNNYPRWINAMSGRRFSILRHANISQVSDFCRGYTTPVIQQQQQQNAALGDGTNNVPEVIRENEYARNLFLNSLNYANSVMPLRTVHAYVTNEEVLKLLEQDWSLLKDDDVVSYLKRLSHNFQYTKQNIDPAQYKDALNEVCLRHRTFSDDNLMVIMKQLIFFKDRMWDHTFYNVLCDTLDNECVLRFGQLPSNNMLLLCDIICQWNKKTPSSYIWYSVRKLGNRVGKLTPQQLVQVLFLLNVCRKPAINMYEMEYKLEHCLDDLSINELGIAALGFFKTGTQIRNPKFLNAILKKTVAGIDFADSVSIGGILKLIRYSMKLTEIPMLKVLLDAMIPHMPRLTLMTLTHAAHAATRVSLYNKEFMDEIIKRLNSELKITRLKNIERLIFVFATLNIDPSNNIYHNVVEELRDTWDTSRALEIAQYPYVASRLLGFLSYLDIYPTDLIKRVMTSPYIHKVCSGNYRMLSREYCVLDYSLRVEVPDYDGPFLNPNIRNYLTKKDFMDNVAGDFTRMNVFLTEVLKTCQETFNNTDISVDCVLPHYLTPDIIICLDQKYEVVPCSKFLSEFSEGDIKRVVDEKSEQMRWIALVMAPIALLIRDSNSYNGLLTAKIRQLSRIGYTPIVISQIDWYEYKTSQERCDYIRTLIFQNNVKETQRASELTNIT